jgi:Protein of unknown function (DUF2892)
MGFVRFMNSTTGRAARIGAGLVLIVGGLIAGGTAGLVVAAVGMVPLAAGLSNVCLFAPLFHAPFRGASGAA